MTQHKLTKAEIVKLWRKYGWGRLFWRQGNNRLWRTWDSDDVAKAVDGTVSMHFKSVAAIVEMIEYGQMVERNRIAMDELDPGYDDPRYGGF